VTLAELASGLPSLLAEIQPGLTARLDTDAIEITGEFRLSDAEGVYDRFQIRLQIPQLYPLSEPKLFETGGRISAGAKRHTNPDGSCCFGIWEKWYFQHPDRSVRALLEGPIKSYFVSQVVYELSGKWPFGEHAHGYAGLVEAGAELFSCTADMNVIKRMIDAILSGKVIASAQCPCGSGVATKDCHQATIEKLHSEFSPLMLKGFKGRLG
jgi:hypothetical protein